VKTHWKDTFTHIDENPTELHIFPYLYSFLEYGAIIAFLWVSKAITYIKIWSVYISESPILERIQSGKELFYRSKNEPKNGWVSICSITNNQLNEIYIPDHEYKNKAVPKPSWLLYNQLYEKVLTQYADGLFVMKLDTQYIYRNIIKPDANENISYRILPSQIRFILIEYKHPNLKGAIYLDIPKTAYITGNDILSKTHVLRCLEYQNEPFLFDERYTLHIMDNQLTEFVIHPNQYCCLHFDQYEILEE